jgi:very-short-patch-repair endonuclease
MRQNPTAAEHLLWACLRRNAIGVPVRRQHVIAGWLVDAYVPAARLVIELDGGVHDHQAAQDAERDETLRALGLRVVRLPNEKFLANHAEVVEQLRQIVSEQCQERALDDP